MSYIPYDDRPTTLPSVLPRRYVMQSKRDKLRQERDNLAAALASVQEKLTAEESLEIPEQPRKNVKFVTFTKWFTNPEKEYTYAAVRRSNLKGTSHLWTISGKNAPGVYTWAQLMDFVQKGETDRQRALDSVRILKPFKHLNQPDVSPVD